jgi:hypothetical protein
MTRIVHGGFCPPSASKTSPKLVLGYGTSDGLGNWTLTLTLNLASGTYTLYAQAQDNYGVVGDPTALTLTVQ